MLRLIALSLVALSLAGSGQASTTSESWQHLAKQARHVALHGGITGTCHGCATAKMQDLMARLYEARFASSGGYAQRTAVCLMKAESGGNPGAISSTGDYGGLQANKQAHGAKHPEWYLPGRGFAYLIFDPGYGAGQMWAMSQGGTSWTSWTGTFGRGICR